MQEIEGLKRALEGQGPYISRLEQQLEHYMNATSGQLGTSTGSNKRRSAIPLVIWTFFLSYPILKWGSIPISALILLQSPWVRDLMYIT